MRATHTLTLYRPSDKVIIAEVYEGEEYNIPNDVKVFEGTNEQFLTENPEYQYQNNQEDLLNFEEI